MSFKKFLVSKVFFFNLIVAIALVSGLLYITLQTLDSYTRHGQSNPVPDFSGLTYSEAVNAAKPHNLKVVIID